MATFTKTYYIDIETGEQIKKDEYLKHYYTVKTNKHVRHSRTNVIIEWTKLIRKRPEQGEIFTENRTD